MLHWLSSKFRLLAPSLAIKISIGYKYEDFKNVLQKKKTSFFCSLFNPSVMHKVHRTSEVKFQ